MCGILGYRPLVPDSDELRSEAFKRLFEQSCVRGLHAYGIAYDSPVGETVDGGVHVHRSFNMRDIPMMFDPQLPTIAHARYCTSGDWSVLENNQPIVVGNMALAMNGVISMGTKEEYEAEFDVKCQVDNDSEIFLRKIAGAVDADDVVRKAEDFVGSMTGSFAGTFLAHGQLFASHNPRRPLWSCLAHGARWYASTADVFLRAGFSGMNPVRVGCEIAS